MLAAPVIVHSTNSPTLLDHHVAQVPHLLSTVALLVSALATIPVWAQQLAVSHLLRCLAHAGFAILVRGGFAISSVASSSAWPVLAIFAAWTTRR